MSENQTSTQNNTYERKWRQHMTRAQPTNGFPFVDTTTTWYQKTMANGTYGHGNLYWTAVVKRQKTGRAAGEPVVNNASRHKSSRKRTSASESQQHRGDNR